MHERLTTVDRHGRGSLLGRTAILASGAGVARMLGVAVFILLARALGVDRFGIFGFAMSVALLLEVIIDMGQSSHVGRIVARGSDRAQRFGALIANKSVLACIAAVAAGCASFAAGRGWDETLAVSLMVLWAGALSVLDSLRSIARSLGLMTADSVVNGGESLGRLVGVAAAWVLGAPLAGYALAFAVECSLAAIVFYVWLARKVRLLPSRVEPAWAWRFLRESAPLGLAGIAFVGFYQIDQVFVRTLAGSAENGLYGAAVRVVLAATGLAALVVVAVYPDLSRYRDDARAFRRHVLAALRLGFSFAAPAAVLIAVFAGPLIRILYGEAYAGSAALLRVLAPIVPLNAVVVTALYVGNALGREKRVLVVVMALLGVNVVANRMLVPSFGAAAAAWISTVGEFAMAAGLLSVSWDRLAARPALLKEAA